MLDPLNLLNRVQLAGVTDIGLMKLDAIADRGRRKDFIDLYFIARFISLDQLLEQSKIKYPYARHFVTRALEALIEFDVAETDSNPQMLFPTDWEQVKAFCIEEALRLGKKNFEEN